MAAAATTFTITTMAATVAVTMAITTVATAATAVTAMSTAMMLLALLDEVVDFLLGSGAVLDDASLEMGSLPASGWFISTVTVSSSTETT